MLLPCNACIVGRMEAVSSTLKLFGIYKQFKTNINLRIGGSGALAVHVQWGGFVFTLAHNFLCFFTFPIGNYCYCCTPVAWLLALTWACASGRPCCNLECPKTQRRKYLKVFHRKAQRGKQRTAQEGWEYFEAIVGGSSCEQPYDTVNTKSWVDRRKDKKAKGMQHQLGSGTVWGDDKQLCVCVCVCVCVHWQGTRLPAQYSLGRMRTAPTHANARSRAHSAHMCERANANMHACTDTHLCNRDTQSCTDAHAHAQAYAHTQTQ